MSTSAQYVRRLLYTKLAFGTHLISLILLSILLYVYKDSAENKPLLFLLTAQECVALIGASFAWVQVQRNGAEFFNSSKWAEYSVSATIGVLAIYISGEGESTWWVITLLIFLSSFQQVLGRILDESINTTKANAQFWLAAGFQLIEFILVGIRSPPVQPAPYLVYVIMWSSFGVVCYMRLKKATSINHPKEWYASRWGSEILYTMLGWTSKISLVITTLPFAFDSGTSAHATSWIMASISLVGTSIILYLTRQAGLHLYREYLSTRDLEESNDIDSKMANPGNFA